MPHKSPAKSGCSMRCNNAKLKTNARNKYIAAGM